MVLSIVSTPAMGSVVWKMRVGPKDDRLLSRGEMISRWPVRTGVLIDGDTAYFGAGVFPHETVYLCAVNAKDGSVIWRNDTISEQDAGRNDLVAARLLAVQRQQVCSFPRAVHCRSRFRNRPAKSFFNDNTPGAPTPVVSSAAPRRYWVTDKFTRAVRITSWRWTRKTGNVGAAWINGRQMVLAGELAYLMDGEKIYCVNRAEHAKASQEKQKWFLKVREFRSDPKKVAEAKQKMKEYARSGIIWEYASDFDDVLIATENLVIAGGMNQI